MIAHVGSQKKPGNWKRFQSTGRGQWRNDRAAAQTWLDANKGDSGGDLLKEADALKINDKAGKPVYPIGFMDKAAADKAAAQPAA